MLQVHPTFIEVAEYDREEKFVTVRPTVPVLCPDGFVSCDLVLQLGRKEFLQFADVASSTCALHFKGSDWDRTKLFGVAAVQDFLKDGNKRALIVLQPFQYFGRTPPEWFSHPPVNIVVSIESTLRITIYYPKG